MRPLLLGQDDRVLGSVSLAPNGKWQVDVWEGTVAEATILLELLFRRIQKRWRPAMTRVEFMQEGPRFSFDLSAWLSRPAPLTPLTDLPTQHASLYAEVEQEIATLTQEYERRQKTQLPRRRA